MAIEATNEATNIAAKFSGLLKWVKEPASQTVNAVAKEELPLWSMYPEFRENVAEKLEENQLEFAFCDNDEDIGSTHSYDTNIKGRFRCGCKKKRPYSWRSNCIAVTIRQYSGDRYNVRVYHQRCKNCKKLCRPILDEESCSERVAYRLKKWSGVEVERPEYSGTKNAFHRTKLCEGCKNGHCSVVNPNEREDVDWSDDDYYYSD
ncbi:uncharacterized protein FFB20_10692 [Fusarium fujikuroi]|uniref:3CxxC-type domain-containing protein n=1 Tax=Fusarium fujikuroi TaxID=5127 RepID=A0A9Q9UDJ7_FUSFU|nr:uncharacterized protein FFB20_10692 [Fusarium fujikuroi]SCO20973.1 uncharacterized protein FFE2_14789 [Fusarium fujikuroi]SCO51193.1 uncharacterized protein FFNC_13672 [Fusarium fujikuroi]SCV59870.1 uncharacterized protein FFFS_14439 [Fusarium fujikuroi]VTT61757.1 unnamed protein product [Fusarium fujikuroi]